MISSLSSFLSPKSTASEAHAAPPVGIRAVDLKLPKNKVPADIEKMRAKWNTKPVSVVANHAVSHKTYAIGSVGDVSYRNDLGLFQTVFESWENHWNVRTCPDDWWFPVACRIAKEIDSAAKPERYNSEEVRKLFVSHEGKEEIAVDCPVWNIYQVDYDAFFSDVSSEIRRRIKVPEYAANMQCDFTTSSSTHRIASQVNLMASMQEFFSYHMHICGCGIKGLEMQGGQADWDNLSTKLKRVKEAIAPIMKYTELYDDWFEHVEYVFDNLAQTYKNPGSPVVTGFWADVLMVGKDWKYGPSGMREREVEAYNGWLIRFLTGKRSIHKEDMGKDTTLEELRGLNCVPMKMSLTYTEPPITDDAELVAGMVGFTAHGLGDTFNGVPSLEPLHMWAMMLPPHSELREKESKRQVAD